MKQKFIFILSIAVLSNFACQKSKLYPVQPTTVTAGTAPFSTPARIQAQVLGLYTTIRNGQLYGGRYQVYNDVKADNWINSTANSVTAYQTWTETVSSTSSEVINLWAQCYLAINDCNLFIDGMGTTGSAVVGTTLATNYIAEAKFIRAIAYYALVEMYCQPYAVNNGASPGVPLRLTGNALYSNYDLAPATVAQVYAQIVTDLTAGETGLPAAYYSSGTTLDASSNTTRASQNTATAFLTKIYLSMQQYASVITEANKIVSGTKAPFTATTGVPYALQTALSNVYKSPYNTTESILSMPFTTTELVGGQNALADYFGGLGSSEFYLNPAGVIADAGWKSTDARRSFITVKSGRSYVTKWTTATTYIDWAPVMRYPEVLLNLAEARARTTNSLDATAIALLNAVRQRSDATTTFTAAGLGNVTGLINVILEERNIEFLGEGLRWNDIWRLDQPIPAKSNVSVVAPTASSYIWPVSNTEQLYNSLIGR